MSKSSLRKKTAKTVALAIALPNLAYAASEVPTLPTVEVQAEDASPYLKHHASSTKRTESLLNTPKTTQVITQQALKDQNLLSLQDALATTPGISFGAGEGGGGYGDKINIRGYNADSNVTVDGLRDTANQVRSDLFNYEAVEITKGANSVENGAGQISGGINLVSKTPKNKDFNEISLGLGTDNYKRFTGDFNHVINEDVAVRLNVMGHKDEYAGRPEERKRWAVAPSITFGLNSATKATLSYFHQEDDNTPQHGVPFFNGKPVKGISASNYYGYLNLDQIKLKNDTATLKIESEINDHLKLNSTTRYSDIQQDATVSVPRGTFCLADGTMPVDSSVAASGYTSCPSGVAAGTYIPGGPRGYINNSHTKQLTNDTNLVSNFTTGSIQHAVVAGLGLSREDYEKHTGSMGLSGASTTMNVYNPSQYWYGATNPTVNLAGRGNLDIYSAYLVDTIKFGPQWMLNLGTRFDHTDGKYTNYNTTTGLVSSVGSQNNNLFSYNVGLLFKPTESTSLYANYSNSQKPVLSSAQSSCDATTTCNVDPEEAVNYEVGVKWTPSTNLLFTLAAFRNEQNKIQVTDNTNTNSYSLDGKSHIDGVEFGIAGNLTPKWDIIASAAWMEGKYDTDVTGSRANFNKGSKKEAVPEWSGSLWTTYALNEHWKLGYGLTYQGKFYVNGIDGSKNPKQYQVDDYLVHNASITYTYNKNLSFSLIGKNLADEEYYTKVRTALTSGFAMPGEGRSAVFNINYSF